MILNSLEILGEKFGFTTNDKRYKVLNPKVRLIQGDGMNEETIGELYEHIIENGWSADNLAVGSGGGLLQQMNRDTERFAFKCCQVMVDDEVRDVYKEPTTDSSKTSKRGDLALIKDGDGDFFTVQRNQAGMADLLLPVFVNGMLIKDFTFAEVRANAKGEQALE